MKKIIISITIFLLMLSCSNNMTVYNYALIGKTSEVKKAIEAGFDINMRDSEMKSLLMYAAMGDDNNLDTVKYLIENGADTTLRDNEGRNVIYYTHYTKNKDIAAYLIKSGAKVDFPDNENKTLLLNAIEVSNVEYTAWYLSLGADPNYKVGNGTLLGFAKWKIENGGGSQEIVNLLIKAGAK